MGILKKLINLSVIFLLSFLLYYLSTSLAQHHQNQENFIHITRAISRGDEFTGQILKQIEKVVGLPLIYSYHKSSSCFIKAFHKLVVEERIDGARQLFTIFQEPFQEFDKVTNCEHYLSLLIFRAQTLQLQNREKILQELYSLQKTWIEELYPKQGRNTQICIYFNVYNIESTAKHQLTMLANQRYQNYNAFIHDDASTDNTQMMIKYTLDELKKDNLVYKQNKEQRLGEVKGFQEWMKNSNCSDNSIVVVLSRNQTLLGENALWIIDRIFANVETDLAFLGSFTSPHSNLENIHSYKDLTSCFMPFMAFRKKLMKALDKPDPITYGTQLIQRNRMSFLLREEALLTRRNVTVLNEAVVYRYSQNDRTVLDNLEQMREIWNF